MILFFLRRYNDIDHIVPIVYRMAKDGVQPIALFCLNPFYDINRDFRLSLLKERWGIPTSHLYKACLPTSFHRIMAWLLCDLGTRFSASKSFFAHSRLGRIFHHVVEKYFFWKGCYRLAKHTLFRKQWASTLFKTLKPKVVVLDWHRPTPFYNIEILLNAAKSLQIPIITVPHGVHLAANEEVYTDMSAFGPTLDYGFYWRYYDHNLVNSEDYRDLVVKGGVKREKVSVIGSPRFCHEWVHQYDEICPKVGIPSQTGRKIRLVFMDHSPAYRTDKKIVVDTIKRLVTRGDVDLIIKPSTGGTGTFSARRNHTACLTDPELLNLCRVMPDIPSVALIRWADAILCINSSICIDVLIKNKIFLYPKYFHQNHMIFDRMGACWTLSDDEELSTALDKISRDPSYRPYDQENVREFLVRTVYGGKENRDVLGDYKEFILSGAKISNSRKEQDPWMQVSKTA